VSILSARALLLSVALGASLACAAQPAIVRERFEREGLTPVDVEITIRSEHRRAQPRYVRAALAALKVGGEWLGAFPRSSLVVVDAPWNERPAAAGDPVVIPRTPWWTSAGAMRPELATARAVSRRLLTELVDATALPPWFVDALAEVAARRAVVELFEKESLPPGYSFVEERYFGGFVPWALRIRLMPAARGDLPDAPTLRAFLALGTLERWLGRPVFDEVVAAFLSAFRTGRPTLGDFARTASRVSGEDLSWFFDQAWDPARTFDYAIERVTSVPAEDSGFLTTVVVHRAGAGAFTGSSRPRVGPFERGRGITIRLAFADGSRVDEHWDGRDAVKTFVFGSPEAAVLATIDPDQVLLLDTRRSNNNWTVTRRGLAAPTRWAVRWELWLENLLLSYASLV
jgi:hypothetical protein